MANNAITNNKGKQRRDKNTIGYYFDFDRYVYNPATDKWETKRHFSFGRAFYNEDTEHYFLFRQNRIPAEILAPVIYAAIELQNKEKAGAATVQDYNAIYKLIETAYLAVGH